jgi:hypothetical protein
MVCGQHFSELQGICDISKSLYRGFGPPTNNYARALGNAKQPCDAIL